MLFWIAIARLVGLLFFTMSALSMRFLRAVKLVFMLVIRSWSCRSTSSIFTWLLFCSFFSSGSSSSSKKPSFLGFFCFDDGIKKYITSATPIKSTNTKNAFIIPFSFTHLKKLSHLKNLSHENPSVALSSDLFGSVFDCVCPGCNCDDGVCPDVCPVAAAGI